MNNQTVHDVNTLTYFTNQSNVLSFGSLEEQNARNAEQRLPAIVFLAFLIVTGILGNVIVLIVYTRYYPSSTFRLYIIILAIIDLLTCCTSMPFEIVDNAMPLLFFNEPLCKSGRFLINILKMASAFVLLVMAAGRYKKICHPFSKSTSIKQARFWSAAAVVLSIAFSWPTIFIQGTKLRHVEGNLTGHDCSISDEFQHTTYPFIYSTILFVIYALIIISLITLYSLVIVTLRKHAKEQEQFHFNDNVQKSSPRITKMMIAITVAFIVCYVPNCILEAITTFKHGYIFPPSPVVLAILPLLARTFFINNVVNPFIYLIGDPKFFDINKQKVRWIFYSLCRRSKKPHKDFAVTETIHLTDVPKSHYENNE